VCDEAEGSSRPAQAGRSSAFYDRARSSLASKRAGNLIAPLGDTHENVRIHSYTWPRPLLAVDRNPERSRPDPRPRLELALVLGRFLRDARRDPARRYVLARAP